jgi:hypothetical protein
MMAAPDWNQFLGQWMAAHLYESDVYPDQTGAQAEYLNTYGKEGEAAMKAAGVQLPQTFVDPSQEPLYRSYWEEHAAHGAVDPNGYDAWKKLWMGDENTAGSGQWVNANGTLQWVPNSAQGSYRDTGSGWLGNLVNAIVNPLGATYNAVSKSAGVFDVADALFDPLLQPGVNAVSAAAGEGLGSSFQEAAPTIGTAVGGVVGSIYGFPEAGAAVGNVIGGKVQGRPNDLNALAGATTYVTASALSGVGDSIKGLGDSIFPADLITIESDVAGGGIESGFGNDGLIGEPSGVLGGGGIESGFGNEGLIGEPSPGILQQVADAVTNPKNIETALNVGSTGMEAIAAFGGGGGEAFPPLPALLSPATPDGPLPDLPDRIALQMPEKLSFPEIEPYLPKNWDSMSDAERESWLITRGGEISKRRKGTWAGNLAGIRGGQGAGLDYAELIGMNEGKQILGA